MARCVGHGDAETSSPASPENPGSILVRVEVQAVNLGARRGDRLLVCGNTLPLMCVDACFFVYCSFTLQFFSHSTSAHVHTPTERTLTGLTFLLEFMPLQRHVGVPQQ